jgi:hypothetical protein
LKRIPLRHRRTRALARRARAAAVRGRTRDAHRGTKQAAVQPHDVQRRVADVADTDGRIGPV